MPYADPTSEAARASQRRRDAKHYAANKEKRAAYQRAWVAKNREYVNASRRDYDARYPERKMLRAAKGRAKERGIEFRLTERDISIPAACPVLGIAIERSGMRNRENSPSLDRLKNDRGYVPGNVAVISHRANRLKADATLEEILAIARYMGQ